ncbi:MAG: hypothetical protein AABW85_00215 [archaeon]
MGILKGKRFIQAIFFPLNVWLAVFRPAEAHLQEPAAKEAMALQLMQFFVLPRHCRLQKPSLFFGLSKKFLTAQLGIFGQLCGAALSCALLLIR